MSDATPSPNTLPTVAPRPVVLSIGGPIGMLSLIELILLHAVSGIVFGLFLYWLFITSHLYLPFLYAVAGGWLLGLATQLFVERFGPNNGIAILLSFVVAGVTTMGTYHVANYIDFRNEIDAMTQAQIKSTIEFAMKQSGKSIDDLRAEFAASKQDFDQVVRDKARADVLKQKTATRSGFEGVGSDSFLSYLTYRSNHGLVTYIDQGKDKGLALTPWLMWTYWGLEIVLVIGVGFGCVWSWLWLPKSPITGRRLMKTAVLGLLDPGDKDGWVNRFATGTLGELRRDQIVNAGVYPAVEVAVRTTTPGVISDEAEQVLEVSWLTKTDKGDLRHRLLGRWLYPVAAVKALAAAFAAAKPKGE